MHIRIRAAAFALITIAPQAANAAEQTIRLSVPGMTCASCPYIVENSIAAVAGVIGVKALFAEREASVTYDDAEATPDAILQATENAGYPAILVAAEQKP